jgi:glutaredoxin-like protein
MAILDDNTRKQVQEILKNMEHEVKLTFFFTESECRFCNEIKTLLKEIAGLSAKIKLEEFDINKHKAEVKKHDIDAAPVIVINGKNKGEIRFYGIPAGHEFGSFIMTLIDVSKGDTDDLDDEVKEEAKKINFEVEMKVFVTPTCPYCPPAVRTAFLFAMYNPKIKAYAYEATEFGELANKYNVRGVPKTVVTVLNNNISFDGALPPDLVLKKIAKLNE